MTYPAPSVGRIVHHVSLAAPVLPDGTQASPPQCQTAFITEVGAWFTGWFPCVDPSAPDLRTFVDKWIPDGCALVVDDPTGQFVNVCEHDEDGQRPGTWHWR